MAGSIVEYFGLGEGHSCGYCGNSDTNVSYGLWAHYMTCQDYEDLMNRGWRRSGKYVYKPRMNVTCCPLYTIRCDATKIKLSKSQKKVLKRMNNFLLNGRQMKLRLQEANDGAEVCDTTKGEKKNNEIDNLNETESRATSDMKCHGASSQMKKDKCPHSGNTNKTAENDGIKTLEDFIAKSNCSSELKHKLEVKLCKVNPIDDHQDFDFEESFSLFCKYQKAVHNDQLEKLTERRIRTVRSHPESTEFTRNIASEYQLFLKYQMDVHKETESENSISQFKRFLVNSPLIAENSRPDVPSMGLGSFHQQYLLDGKLIAVGVIDILPHCVSSKYFFYDPEYSFLSLGTYSALWEIYFVRRLQEECANLKYYYMGYYVHSCHKMRYKGSYDPSFLLCPESYKFQPIKTCLDKLNSSKYSRLATEDEISDEEAHVQVNSALILHNNMSMSFQTYAEVFLSDENSIQEESKEVLEYCQLVGRTSEKILLFRK